MYSFSIPGLGRRVDAGHLTSVVAIALFTAGCLSSQGVGPNASQPLETVPFVDLERFAGLPEEEYKAAKAKAAERAIEASTMFFPDWRPHTIFRDVFTPRTIKHFTGHVNGAVYGSPNKRLTGETGIHGLYLCGTDQGYLGVIGAMVSGVAMANRHALVAV